MNSEWHENSVVDLSADKRSARGPYKKSSLTKQRLVDAATTVFAERGYRNGSTATIAALADVSPPQVYYYFGSKQALLDAVLQRRDRLADEVDALGSADPRAIPAAFLRIAANNESVPEFISLYSLLLAESTGRGHPARGYFKDRYRRLRSRFREAFEHMDAGGLLALGVDPDHAASSTLALWDGLQMQWLVEPETVDVVECLRRHLLTLTTVAIRDVRVDDETS